MNQPPTILFDGDCNFCNSAVNFVVRRDKKQIIRFAPLQSGAGNTLLAQYNLTGDSYNSFIFINNGIPYTKSTAALQVCKYLSGLWPLCYALIVIPRFLRDPVYNWVARNRYKWFGKKDVCQVVNPELRARFLS